MSWPGGQVVVLDLVGVLARPSWRELHPAPGTARWRELRVGAIEEEEFWGLELAAAFRGALGLRRDRVALLGRLKDAGASVVIASNFARAWAPVIAGLMPMGLVDRWCVSGALGVAKPDPAFWAAVGAPRGAVVVDDKPANVASATAAGLRGVLAGPGVDLEAALWAMSRSGDTAGESR